MSGFRLRLGQGVAVLVAMAVGTVITTHLSVGQASVASFEHDAGAGGTAHLSYGDVSIDDVRGAALLGPPGSDSLAVRPGGVWVVVTVAVRATREPTSFQALVLVDDQGRRYQRSVRSTCPTRVASDTGVTTHAMLCFDVPADVVAGLRLLAGRGDETNDGLRRDDVALVDLGIDDDEAAEIADEETSLRVQEAGIQPIEPIEITLNEVDP